MKSGRVTTSLAQQKAREKQGINWMMHGFDASVKCIRSKVINSGTLEENLGQLLLEETAIILKSIERILTTLNTKD